MFSHSQSLFSTVLVNAMLAGPILLTIPLTGCSYILTALCSVVSQVDDASKQLTCWIIYPLFTTLKGYVLSVWFALLHHHYQTLPCNNFKQINCLWNACQQYCYHPIPCYYLELIQIEKMFLYTCDCVGVYMSRIRHSLIMIHHLDYGSSCRLQIRFQSVSVWQRCLRAAAAAASKIAACRPYFPAI